jgi:hypothetical protein
MFTTTAFAVSGTAILVFLLTKVIEKRSEKTFFLSRWISNGDTHMRNLSHRFTHFYSEFKERSQFLFQKQIPMHTKKTWNKISTKIEETVSENLVKMRGIKSMGSNQQDISEFFKSISDSEKTNGEINHIFEEGSQIEEKELE